MQTTLIIDDDVLAEAEAVAKKTGQTVGQVISVATRKVLKPEPQPAKGRSGFPLLPLREGSFPVTSEDIHRLEEDSFWEEYLQKEANAS